MNKTFHVYFVACVCLCFFFFYIPFIGLEKIYIHSLTLYALPHFTFLSLHFTFQLYIHSYRLTISLPFTTSTHTLNLPPTLYSTIYHYIFSVLRSAIESIWPPTFYPFHAVESTLPHTISKFLKLHLHSPR